jgi:hypothetical protein
VIYAAENSNKFQKNRFWKAKSVEDVVTLGPTAQSHLLLNNPSTVDGAGIPYSFFKTGGRYYGSTFAGSPLIILFSELLKVETIPKYIFF